MKRPLKRDHWVRTADGTVGKIYHIGKKHIEGGVWTEEDYAEILIDGNWEDRLELPVSELRRIPDPNSERRIPVEGMPAERPVCAYCGKPFKAVYKFSFLFPKDGTPKRKVWERWDSYYGIFDKLVCAARFGEAAYNAGYRIRKG